MTTLVTVAVLASAGVVALHMVLSFKAGGFRPFTTGLWAGCPCGHEASWHEDGRDGCRSKDVGTYKSDCYGYCPCPQTRASVEARTSMPSAA